IFVVNKSDRHGAEAMVINLRSLTQLRKKYSTLPWEQPVIKTVATEDVGIDIVLDKLEQFEIMLKKHDNWQSIRNERMMSKVFQLINEALSDFFWTKERKKFLNKELRLSEKIDKSPFRIAENLLSSLRNT
ncbi:MAG: hypothetical protein U9O95_03350, partial [Candidatus Marinimicrobia bacterium]|nr:hypothetical protein [Candidatus Neomarinimicrobiota bacterium]